MNVSDPRAIHVEVQPNYVPEQSEPDQQRFVFSYTVTITNQGAHTAQLHSRHWIITDGNGLVQEVRGRGVVGEQPRLQPGQSFRYTSGTVLPTPVGIMQGSYRMQDENGLDFDAEIKPFRLAVPGVLH